MAHGTRLNNKLMARTRKQFPVGAADLKPGEKRIVEINGRSVGIFNVNGDYYALHNRCPHMGGNLCEGPVTGTTLYTDKTEFVYGRENELVRCGWHGWEFEIKTGQCLVKQQMRVRTYQVSAENGQLILHI